MLIAARKTRALYKKQPQTIVVTAFKNGSRDVFARIAAPTMKMVNNIQYIYRYIIEIHVSYMITELNRARI